MVFVKVRETYDLNTVQNKMSVIAIHTPNPQIIKANFPGLLMQCKAYRPFSCDVRLACASVLPMDPLGVGTTQDDVAPEDLFNPILYKALSNFGMSQLEARIAYLGNAATAVSGGDLNGPSAVVDADSVTDREDEFNVYYGLLSNCHGWKHAAPQNGLTMSNLRPLVYEKLYNIGDTGRFGLASNTDVYSYPDADSDKVLGNISAIRGNGKPLPMMPCTSYSENTVQNPFATEGNPEGLPGFHAQDVPWINCVVAGIIVPPSRLHQLFYRMVVEWTIEFSGIRPVSEVGSLNSLWGMGTISHFQNYDYSATKADLTGDSSTILSNDASMVSTNADIKKVM